jgi:hypothetical protein
MTPRMQNWLFMICTGLLYFGPMLAGLAGYGWAVVPYFIAVFMIWQVLRSPKLWPRSVTDWKSAPVLINLTSRLMVQAGLVIFCFVIARGIGGVTNILPPLLIGTPLGISLLALPFSRLLHPAKPVPSQTAASAPMDALNA